MSLFFVVFYLLNGMRIRMLTAPGYSEQNARNELARASGYGAPKRPAKFFRDNRKIPIRIAASRYVIGVRANGASAQAGCEKYKGG